MDDLKIYSAIYEKMNEKLAISGKEMPFSKDAFLVYTKTMPYRADYLQMIDLPNQAFLEAAYLCLFNRPPEQAALDNWQAKINSLKPEEFQNEVLGQLKNSKEFENKGCQLYNATILPDNLASAKRYTSIHSQASRIYRKFLPLYMKLPSGTRGWFKRKFRKYVFGPDM